ncbi:MAG: hypothetical protein KGL39_31000 [Patescibacteria group bacterium]|nr:hypothetical protein [Patescibacteria group bacterium]
MGDVKIEGFEQFDQDASTGDVVWLADRWCVVIHEARGGRAGSAIPLRLPKGYAVWFAGFAQDSAERLCAEFAEGIGRGAEYADQCAVNYSDGIGNDGTIYYRVVGPDDAAGPWASVETALSKGYRLGDPCPVPPLPKPRRGRF